MDAKDIRALLAKQREQKFRTKTDAQLQAIDVNRYKNKKFWTTPEGLSRKEDLRSKTLDKDFLEKRAKEVLKKRGVPCKFISPDGKEFVFQGTAEADRHFGFSVSSHFTNLQGAKRIQRKQLKNWIIHRLDHDVSKEELENLKQEVARKVNPSKLKSKPEKIVYEGKTYKQLEEEYGHKPYTIRKHLKLHGNLDSISNLPGLGEKIVYEGKTYKQLEEEFGVSSHTIRAHLKKYNNLDKLKKKQ